jgi:Protein of unknown function (DUF2441)
MAAPPRIDIGSRLFLTAAPDLPVGSLLSPGHWLPHVESMVVGRRSLDGELVWHPDLAHILLELACETTRGREFPHLPSRLDCLFLWADEREARAWRYRKHVHQGSTAGLYEVEVVACVRAAALDHNLVSYLAGETAGALLDQARRYWRGERTGPAEILLEGSVQVVRDLLALRAEALEVVKDPLTDQVMPTALQWGAPDEAPPRLALVRVGRYHLQASLAADPALPMTLAGWVALECEALAEPALARRGTSPVLVRPGEWCEVSAAFTELPPLAPGTRYRPVLLCDRAAAHYWQLPRFWQGRVSGNWQTL